MRCHLWAWGLILLLLAKPGIAVEQGKPVKVGIYHFPPYSYVNGGVSGISVELLALMNQAQQKYRFIPVATTPKRRYDDFERGLFDMLVFENKDWGWQQFPVVASQPFLDGGEFYVALAKEGRDQSYFVSFKDKVIIGVLGYHYGFAQFNADIDYLNSHFDIVLTDDHENSLNLIRNRRGDIAVLPKAYIDYYFSLNPGLRSDMLISDKPDQVYHHSVLLRESLAQITIADINQLLSTMKKQGRLQPLWQKYHLD